MKIEKPGVGCRLYAIKYPSTETEKKYPHMLDMKDNWHIYLFCKMITLILGLVLALD